MKSNPYVFPSKDFFDLSFKKFFDNFQGEKQIDLFQLKKIVEEIKLPLIKIKPKKLLSEQILEFFLNPEIRFGSSRYIKENKDFFQKRLNYFIQNQKPIVFTLLGFPFKMPVSLKTDRTLPDMGEVLFLNRLFRIAEFIQENIYSPGVKIYVFSEDCFAPFVDLPLKEAENYHRFLLFLNKKLGFDRFIQIVRLKEMEKDPLFQEVFEKNLQENLKLYEKKDKEFLKKYRQTLKPIFRLVNSREFPLEVLMDVYNDQLKIKELSLNARKIRKKLLKKAQQAIFSYFAYLKTRDDLRFLEKKAPFALPLTVSPKPYRLGIWPIRKNCWILPYHGVPVFYKKENFWDLRYLIDLRREKKPILKVFLKEDKEAKPFFYEI